MNLDSNLSGSWQTSQDDGARTAYNDPLGAHENLIMQETTSTPIPSQNVESSTARAFDWSFGGYHNLEATDLLTLLEMDLSEVTPPSFSETAHNTSYASPSEDISMVTEDTSTDGGLSLATTRFLEDKLSSTNEAISGLRASRPRFTASQSRIMVDWLIEHVRNPYPTQQEKDSLATTTGLTTKQVQSWFTRARKQIRERQDYRRSLGAPVEMSRNEQEHPSGSSNDQMDDDDDDDHSDIREAKRARLQEEGTSLSEELQTSSDVASLDVMVPSPHSSLSSSDGSPDPWAKYDEMASRRMQNTIALGDFARSYLSWWLEGLPSEVKSYCVSGVEPLPPHDLILGWSSTLNLIDRPLSATTSNASHVSSHVAVQELQDTNDNMYFDMSAMLEDTPTSVASTPFNDTASTASFGLRSDFNLSTIDSHSSIQTTGSYTSFGGSSGRQLPPFHGLPKMSKIPKNQTAKYRCTFCDQVFQDAWRWKRHESALHVPNSVWVCRPWSSYCNEDLVNCWLKPVQERTFNRPDGLKQHLERSHKVNLKQGGTFDWQSIAASCTEKIALNVDLRCPFTTCDEQLSDWSQRVNHVQSHFEKGERHDSTITAPSSVNRPDIDISKLNDSIVKYRLDGSSATCPESGCGWEARSNSEIELQYHMLTAHWDNLQSDQETTQLSPPVASPLFRHFDPHSHRKRKRP